MTEDPTDRHAYQSTNNAKSEDHSNEPVAIVGRELTARGEIGGPVGIPVEDLPRHALIAGTTGSGKSTTATWTTTTASARTDGATIVVNPKSNDWIGQIARAEYAREGSLDHVSVFDVTDALPAISFFDVRPMVAAGVPRRRAVEAVADHFLAILDHAKPDGFQAIRAPDVIRYLIIALFDPEYGSDAFPLTALTDAVYALRQNSDLPPVSTAWAQELLDSLTDGTRQMRQQILQGAVTRVEKFSGSGYLRPMFTHSPADPTDAFRFSDWLDQDVMLLFDLGGLSDRGQRILGATLLSLLWRAGTQRAHTTTATADTTATDDPQGDRTAPTTSVRSDENDAGTSAASDEPAPETPPTALVCIDELGQLGVDELLGPVLALGREHRLGVLGLVQFPAQLQSEAGAGDSDAYAEVLTNINNLVLGRFTPSDALVQRLAYSGMTTNEVERRLTMLPDNRWLFAPAGSRTTGPIPPHLIAEPPLPQGHPDGQWSLTQAQRTDFRAALDTARERTRDAYTVPYDDYTAASTPSTEEPHPHLDADVWTTLTDTSFRTVLPVLDSLPSNVTYDTDRDVLRCETCGSMHTPEIDGLLDAVACHGSVADTDRTAIPPLTLELACTPDELTAGPVTATQAIALQVVYNVMAGRYDRREFDPVFDRLHDLLDTLGIPSESLSALVEDGYLQRAQLREYVYYSVTSTGRDLINESHRRGIDWGEAAGDLTESLLHAVMVQALARYLRTEHVADDSSPVTEVRTYYELDETTAADAGLDSRVRFDVVGLTADGTIHIIGEAERANNDRAVAAIHDYDQIATVESQKAIWVVPSSGRGHEAVLQPLANPPTDHDDVEDSSQRIPEYSDTTRISDISGIDTPGLTAIRTLSSLRGAIPEPTIDEPRPEGS